MVQKIAPGPGVSTNGFLLANKRINAVSESNYDRSMKTMLPRCVWSDFFFLLFACIMCHDRWLSSLSPDMPVFVYVRISASFQVLSVSLASSLSTCLLERFSLVCRVREVRTLYFAVAKSSSTQSYTHTHTHTHTHTSTHPHPPT